MSTGRIAARRHDRADCVEILLRVDAARRRIFSIGNRDAKPEIECAQLFEPFLALERTRRRGRQRLEPAGAVGVDADVAARRFSGRANRPVRDCLTAEVERETVPVRDGP